MLGRRSGHKKASASGFDSSQVGPLVRGAGPLRP